jgi:hypothetical protein
MLPTPIIIASSSFPNEQAPPDTAGLRPRSDAAKRYEKVANAIVVIWKRHLIAEQRFRKPHAPEKTNQVHLHIGLLDSAPDII